MTKIGLLGDVHSNFPYIARAISLFHEQGIQTILQVGDLGIWPGKSYATRWDAINNQLKTLEMQLLVAPGNHEDYDQINAIPQNPFGWQEFRSNIVLAPRGARWEWEGASFVFLGGAPSVDRWWRLQPIKARGKIWWAEEFLEQADIDRTVAGGHADVMISHDAPHGIKAIHEVIKDNPHGFKQWDIEYAYEGRTKFTEAFDGVKPKFLIHGHYHLAYTEQMNGTLCVGLASDHSLKGTLGELNIVDGKVEDVVLWDLVVDREGRIVKQR